MIYSTGFLLFNEKTIMLDVIFSIVHSKNILPRGKKTYVDLSTRTDYPITYNPAIHAENLIFSMINPVNSVDLDFPHRRIGKNSQLDRFRLLCQSRVEPSLQAGHIISEPIVMAQAERAENDFFRKEPGQQQIALLVQFNGLNVCAGAGYLVPKKHIPVWIVTHDKDFPGTAANGIRQS